MYPNTSFLREILNCIDVYHNFLLFQKTIFFQKIFFLFFRIQFWNAEVCLLTSLQDYQKLRSQQNGPEKFGKHLVVSTGTLNCLSCFERHVNIVGFIKKEQFWKRVIQNNGLYYSQVTLHLGFHYSQVQNPRTQFL